MKDKLLRLQTYTDEAEQIVIDQSERLHDTARKQTQDQPGTSKFRNTGYSQRTAKDLWDDVDKEISEHDSWFQDDKEEVKNGTNQSLTKSMLKMGPVLKIIPEDGNSENSVSINITLSDQSNTNQQQA